MKGFYTANQIIDESLAGVQDFERKYYNEAAMYFLRGFRTFKLFHEAGCVKEAWLPITPINTVNYPEDVMRLITVGVSVNKELFTFTRSDKIVSPISSPIDAVFDTDREENDSIERTPTDGYGTKGANVEYYYKDEPDKRRIVLGRLAVDKTRFADRSEVLLRYVSTGVDNLDSTYIPNEAANLLISYIEYKLVESRPDKYSRFYIADKKENYREEVNMYDALNLPSLDELADMIMETSSQNVRRV